MKVLGKDLVEGDFYHSYSTHLCGEVKFDDVWYSNGRSLINPRDKDHWVLHMSAEFYFPLTIEEVDAFTDWMTENGDEAGIKAWNEYKARLIKEAKMAKNNKDVDLYNSKFVHFEWSVDLKGKEGFYGDLIDELRADVRNNSVVGVCDRFGDPGFPIHIKDDGIYRFFYYDPNYEVKWAYFKEGKPIQIRRDSADYWKDIYCCGEMPTTIDCVITPIEGPEFFDDDFEYRIKPEEPTDKIKVDVKIWIQPSVDSFHMTINGKACTFDNVDDARKVLGLDVKEVADE